MKARARRMRRWFFLVLLSAAALEGGQSIDLTLQRRIAIGPVEPVSDFPPFLAGTWAPVHEHLTIDPGRMAIVVVDMWDSHTCGTMLQKVVALIPPMNRFLRAARALGIQVIFAPSRCGIADKWKGKPQRTRVERLPGFPLPPSNLFNPAKWPGWQAPCMCPVYEIEVETGNPLHPCDRQPPSSDQHPDLEVTPEDLFIDAGVPHARLKALGADASIDTWGEAAQQELYNICMAQGITHLLYTGCATNMCIVNREFAMVQARRMGLTPILVRDLTHALTYNGYHPDTRSLDAKFTPAYGTELCIREIEKYIGPTIKSDQLIAAAGMMNAEPEPAAIAPVFSAEEVTRYAPIGASNCYRQLCLDFNWSGGDVEDYFTEAHPEEIAEFCSAINLDALLLLNVPHQGYTTYRSEIGPLFPGLKDDFFNRVLQACHARNIAVIGYISLARNWIYSENHPEQSWLRGKSEKFIDLKTPYLDLVQAYIQEVLRSCPVDALRFDTLEDDPNSRNRWAAEAYRQLYEEPLPERWDESQWRRKWDFYRWSTSRAVQLCYETAKAVKPEIEIWQNGFMQSAAFDINDMEAGRYQDMAYIEYGDPFRQLFLTGVLGLKGCIVGKILESPVRRLCMALGGRCYSYYRVNPKTALPEQREWFFNDLAPFYAMVKEIQPYLEKAHPVPYFGILYAEATRYRSYQYDRSWYVYDIMKPLTMSYLDRSLVTEYLCNLDLGRRALEPFKLILVPETSGLQAEERKALLEYVRDGGQLLLTGEALCYDEKGHRLTDFSIADEMGASYGARWNTGDGQPRKLPIIHNHLRSASSWPDSVIVRQLITIAPQKGETSLFVNLDGQRVPLFHVHPFGRGRIGYLATSDDIDLMRAVVDAMIAATPVTVTPAAEQIILTRQQEQKRWVLHLLSDNDLVVDLDARFAAPERIVHQYPESGWTATVEPSKNRLRIRASRGARDRLLVLE